MSNNSSGSSRKCAFCPLWWEEGWDECWPTRGVCSAQKGVVGPLAMVFKGVCRLLTVGEEETLYTPGTVRTRFGHEILGPLSRGAAVDGDQLLCRELTFSRSYDLERNDVANVKETSYLPMSLRTAMLERNVKSKTRT